MIKRNHSGKHKESSIDLPELPTQVEPFSRIMAAYRAFDLWEPDWIKVELIFGK